MSRSSDIICFHQPRNNGRFDVWVFGKKLFCRICVFEYCVARNRQWKVYFLQQWIDGLSEMIHREQNINTMNLFALYILELEKRSIMSFSKELNDWFEKMPLATQPFESINVQDYLIESYYIRIIFKCMLFWWTGKKFSTFS